MEGWPARGLTAQLFVEQPDALYEQAVRAGATSLMPMTDMFFGIREGRVSDPFGNIWIIAARKERLSSEEMQQRLRTAGY
jgi:PhnB protein